MEKVLSTEDKIRRAEEIYNRRKEYIQSSGTAKVNINDKKDIKLLKKLFIQIIICLAIYSLFYLVKHNNYIFSEDFINKSKEILYYDINFQEVYNRGIEFIKNKEENTDKSENVEVENNEDKNNESIGGIEENTEESNQNYNELSQMEQDVINIKNSINFINPIEGTVTSSFGLRESSTNTVPKYHTGIDIANVKGTKIYSATDGSVILASSEGDYRKSFKNTDW